jgi:hypothetical protein
MSAFDKMVAAASNKAALYSNGTGKKIAGEGTFYAALVSAEVADNRAGTSKRVALTYKVLDVIEGDPADLGRELTEYISANSSEDIIQRKCGILYNEAIRAGIKKEKLEEESDDSIFDVLITVQGAVNTFIGKSANAGKVRAIVKRVKTDKMAENGRPYFNNYFQDDKLDDYEEQHEDVVNSATEQKPVAEEAAPQSPYKMKEED